MDYFKTCVMGCWDGEGVDLDDSEIEVEDRYSGKEYGSFQTLHIGSDNMLRVGIRMYRENDYEPELGYEEFSDINIISLFEILEYVMEMPNFSLDINKKAFKTMNESNIKKFNDFK